jgi:hypothetical protein
LKELNRVLDIGKPSVFERHTLESLFFMSLTLDGPMGFVVPTVSTTPLSKIETSIPAPAGNDAWTKDWMAKHITENPKDGYSKRDGFFEGFLLRPPCLVVKRPSFFWEDLDISAKLLFDPLDECESFPHSIFKVL